jgi:hypothetical protein
MTGNGYILYYWSLRKVTDVSSPSNDTCTQYVASASPWVYKSLHSSRIAFMAFDREAGKYCNVIFF